MASLHQSYEFWFYHEDIRITATFLGPHAWRYSGPDHTFPHQKRRKWALTLVNAFPDSWRALPADDYLNTLQKRGFKYEEFLVQKSADKKDIQILCRSISHL